MEAPNITKASAKTPLKEHDKELLAFFYETMLKIRKFERTVEEKFLAGEIPGFVHLYIGEEAVATGVMANLTHKDYIESTHRGHGHTIAKGADLKPMMAEIYGKRTGCCKGKGGSMHIADFSVGMLGANGVVGGGYTLAAGAALAQKMQGRKDVSVVFFGDGASNRGTFHESLNMAASQNLPVIYACENNNYAMSTSFPYHSNNKTIAQRAQAYDIPGVGVDGNDVEAVRAAAMEAVERARTGGGPTLLEFRTWRHHGHFLADPQNYKDPEEQASWLAQDPIPRFEKRLLESGAANQGELDRIKTEVNAEIQLAVAFAEESPAPTFDVLFEDLYV